MAPLSLLSGQFQEQNSRHNWLFVFCTTLLGGVWFGLFCTPIAGHLDSDSAIPYLMTTTPWLPQDVYYWGSLRFGWYYSVLYKALIPWWHGDDAHLFFTLHAMLAFAAVGVFALLLRSWLLRIAAVLVLVPLTHYEMEYKLFPGQVYPSLSFIYALFLLLWYPSRDPVSGRRNMQIATLGFLTGWAYWVHDGAGILLFLVCLLDAVLRTNSFHPKTLGGIGQWPWRKMVLFALPLLFFVLISQWGRAAMLSWSLQEADHQAMASDRKIALSIWEFFKSSLPVYGTGYGNKLWGWIVCGVLGFGIWRGMKQRKSISPSAVAGDYAAQYKLMILGIVTVFGVGMVLSSNWYVSNGRLARYFYFVSILGGWTFLLAADRWLQSRSAGIRPHWKIIFAKSLLFAGLLLGSHDWFAAETIWQAQYWQRAAEKTAERQVLTRQLLQSGCTCYRGTYWDSYMVQLISENSILGIPKDSMRGRYFLEICQTAAERICDE